MATALLAPAPADLESSEEDVIEQEGETGTPRVESEKPSTSAPKALAANALAAQEAKTETPQPPAAAEMADLEVLAAKIAAPSFAVMNQRKFRLVDAYLETQASQCSLAEIQVLREQERQLVALGKLFPAKRELEKLKQSIRAANRDAAGDKKLGVLDSIFSDSNLDKMSVPQLEKARDIVSHVQVRLQSDEALKNVAPDRDLSSTLPVLVGQALSDLNQNMELHIVRDDKKRGRDFCDVLEDEIYKKVRERVEQRLPRVA